MFLKLLGLFFFLIKFVLFFFFLFLSVAFLTLLERKLLGLIGLRLGPFKVFFIGLLQPISDAVKLANKNVNVLSNFSFFFYYFSSFLVLFCSIFLWFLFPFSFSYFFLKFSVLFLIIVLSFSSLSSIFCGWRTFGKYSLIGALRFVVQLISYEALLYICLFFFVYFFFSFNFFSFNFFSFRFFFFLPSCFFIWVFSVLAELNRSPFDFSEGERELVRGFNTELGRSCFTLVFLSEYSNIIFFSFLSSFLFFFNFFNFFVFFFPFFFIWVRSFLPRFRFDKLMFLSWKFFIPFLTFYISFFFVFLFF